MGVWYRSNLLLFLQVVDRIITELCVFDVDKVHFFGIFSISHPIFAYPPRLLTLFLPPPSPCLQIKGELILVEIFPGVTVEEVRAKTGADFRQAEGGVKVVNV